MKRLALTLLLSAALVTPCYGSTANCHELVMSYVIADQDSPSMPGDKLYSEYGGVQAVLMHTTAYHEGSHGSHGDKMREGYCALAPDMYGSAAIVYEAVQQEDGSFKIGSYLDTFEIRDCGYGYSTGEGKSLVRPDKKYAGTIESGVHIDVYRNNLSRCWQWMKQSKGFVFVEIVPAKG